ncbi:acyltransferase family protein [Empedobacter brevis]
MKYRLDIQGFRFLAVFLVFIYHLNEKWLSGGFIGVDIFLVISGYLITGIILNDFEKKRFNIIKFYKNRIFRIVPVYYLMLIFVAICGLFIYISTNAGSLKLNIFHSILFNSNSHLSKLDSYFGESSYENPLLHTWSLAIEMKFYLIFPFLLLLINKINKKYFFIIILILTILSLFYSQYEIQFNNNKQDAYFSLASRSWEFLIGALVAIKPIKIKSLVVRNILSFFGILLILGCSLIYSSYSAFPGILALLPCISVLFLLITEGSIINNFLSKKIFVKIGELSYSIYLWHWPIMAFLRYYKNQYEFSLIEMILITLLTISLSILSYNLIEKKTKILKEKVTIIGLSTSALSLILIVFFYNKIHNNFSNIPSEYSNFYPMGIISHGKYYEKEEFIGGHSSSDTILLIGDSHALVMKPYFDYIGKKNDFTVQTITNDIYVPLKGLDPKSIDEERRRDDYIKLSEITENLLTKYNKIFIVRSWGNPERTEGFKLMLNELLPKIKDNQKVILISDFPSIDKSPLRLNNGIIKKSNYQFIKTYHEIPQEIKQFKVGSNKVEYWNITDKDFFNNAPYFNDTIMYYDVNHINKYGSINYAAKTEKIFMKYYSK